MVGGCQNACSVHFTELVGKVSLFGVENVPYNFDHKHLGTPMYPKSTPYLHELNSNAIILQIQVFSASILQRFPLDGTWPNFESLIYFLGGHEGM